MKAKDCPMTKVLCQLVSQAVADAEKEVIGGVEVAGKEAIEETEVAIEDKKPRKKKEIISEEIPVEEALAEEVGQPRTAIDLKCMEKLQEAHRWCEETEIFGT